MSTKKDWVIVITLVNGKVEHQPVPNCTETVVRNLTNDYRKADNISSAWYKEDKK